MSNRYFMRSSERSSHGSRRDGHFRFGIISDDSESAHHHRPDLDLSDREAGTRAAMVQADP
jgi:hypothetical protein